MDLPEPLLDVADAISGLNQHLTQITEILLQLNETRDQLDARQIGGLTAALFGPDGLVDLTVMTGTHLADAPAIHALPDHRKELFAHHVQGLVQALTGTEAPYHAQEAAAAADEWAELPTPITA